MKDEKWQDQQIGGLEEWQTHGRTMDTLQKLEILFGTLNNLLNKLYWTLSAHHNLLENLKKMSCMGSNPVDSESLSIYGFEKSTGDSNM